MLTFLLVFLFFFALIMGMCLFPVFFKREALRGSCGGIQKFTEEPCEMCGSKTGCDTKENENVPFEPR